MNVIVKHVSLLIQKLQGIGALVKPLAIHLNLHFIGFLPQFQPLAQTIVLHIVLLNGLNAISMLAIILLNLDLIALTLILAVLLISFPNYGRALSRQRVSSNVNTFSQLLGFLVKLLPALVLQVLEDSVKLTQFAKHLARPLDHGSQTHKILVIIIATQLI